MKPKQRKPTALQLFRQLEKVRQLQDKVRQEQSKMSEMAAQAREFFFNPEKVIVDGVIYEVSTEGGNSVWSFNNRIETKEIGTVSEFEGLLK